MTAKGSSPVLKLENVGKQFQISTLKARETFPETALRLITGHSARKPLWALRDINLELHHGEILGLIGPNGAGKSTMLLLLAEILAPTEGSMKIKGRTCLFFQLSSGLQPKLTVLENFSVCAALLGMPRKSFRRKLPEIIEFSGLRDYLHARFGELSTGLAARVAFSTAVHTDLDIILADEMLAVGDQAFQDKCLATFRDFQKRGKTMIIASHIMNLIESMCGRTLYLNGGKTAFLGDTKEAVARFQKDMRGGLISDGKPVTLS